MDKYTFYTNNSSKCKLWNCSRNFLTTNTNYSSNNNCLRPSYIPQTNNLSFLSGISKRKSNKSYCSQRTYFCKCKCTWNKRTERRKLLDEESEQAQLINLYIPNYNINCFFSILPYKRNRTYFLLIFLFYILQSQDCIH